MRVLPERGVGRGVLTHRGTPERTLEAVEVRRPTARFDHGHVRLSAVVLERRAADVDPGQRRGDRLGTGEPGREPVGGKFLRGETACVRRR